MTLEDRLIAVGRRPAGFDYMRLVLATLVVLTHTLVVGEGLAVHLAFWGGPIRPFHALILPMFFALSGFLVAGSIERCRTLISFIGLRGLRILPALAVETTLSALILGPIFTSHSLGAYFADPTLRAYFLNIIGDIHFGLPGVYVGNPMSGVVNGQLWTLPFELKCYGMLAILAAGAVVHRPKFLIPFLLALNLLIGLRAEVLRHIDRAHLVPGGVLVLVFLYGLTLFLNRARVPWSGRLALASGMVSMACLAIPHMDYLSPLPVAYLTAYVGLLHPKRIKVLLAGDLSYGIFLYGYPLQQAVVAVLGPMPWWENMLIALPIIVAFAAFSWWVIEKPALALRGQLARLETAAMAFFGSMRWGWLVLRHTGLPTTAPRKV